jgi:predicted nuclease of restriction endonuclease-like (RecB) superfamily
MTGLSARNLKYMRALGKAYSDEQFVQPVVAQIPWGTTSVFWSMSKLQRKESATFGRPSRMDGVGRSSCTKLKTGLYTRRWKARTNFTRTLPAAQCDLTQQIIKDPYNFDFLTLVPEARERELERSLIEHIRDFLLELGVGSAFVGSHYPLEIGGEEFPTNLLLYFLRLQAFVVIGIKVADFQPESAGKMNFCLSASDDLLRQPDDRPSIGMVSANRRTDCGGVRAPGSPKACGRFRIPSDRSSAEGPAWECQQSKRWKRS